MTTGKVVRLRDLRVPEVFAVGIVRGENQPQLGGVESADRVLC